MSRRYLLTTVGIILGALALGLYFTQVNAADKSVTISQGDLQKLVNRINTLEQRVEAIEQKGGIHLLNNSGAFILPEQYPNDGFGPARTIRIDTVPSPK
jgi:hypothetical protein